MFVSVVNQGGMGHCAVYYTSPQRFVITFSCMLAQQLWGLSLDFNWLVNQVKCPNVSTTNYNLLGGQFCLALWGFSSIYLPLSYPFRSLS